MTGGDWGSNTRVAVASATCLVSKPLHLSRASTDEAIVPRNDINASRRGQSTGHVRLNDCCILTYRIGESGVADQVRFREGFVLVQQILAFDRRDRGFYECVKCRP